MVSMVAYGLVGAWSLLDGYAKAKSQRVTQNPLSRFISSSSDDRLKKLHDCEKIIPMKCFQ